MDKITRMKLYEDANPRGMEDSVSQAVQWIKTNGMKWIEETQGRVAWRGAREDYGYATVRPIRTNRAPSDSSQSMHEMMNDLISDAGKYANRENALFVTGDQKFASDYKFRRGRTYVVVPQDGYHYTWSPTMRDAYTWMDVMNKVQIQRQQTNGDMDEMYAEMDRRAAEVKWLGDDGTLRDALMSGHEIMVASRSALYIAQPIVRYVYSQVGVKLSKTNL